jgi:putative flippase GtrA
MNASPSREANHRVYLVSPFSDTLREAPRYLAASAVALAIDASLYLGLIRFLDIHYLAAAPIGYVIGVIVIYVLSTKWVFRNRRLKKAQHEFLIFALIGVVGLVLNQLVIFFCIDRLSTSYELAKLASAAIVFGFNFSGRKLLLFTRF